jgi:hypothetical protein
MNRVLAASSPCAPQISSSTLTRQAHGQRTDRSNPMPGRIRDTLSLILIFALFAGFWIATP